MQAGPRLPPEICLDIIDYLYDCPTSLKDCSLVCRAWLATSHSHLFSRIVFFLRANCSNRFQRLYNVIEQSPSIALHIKELVIMRNLELSPMLDPEWHKLGTIIVPLFGKLTALQKFDVTELNWSHLTPNVRSSVRTLLALPSLVHLAIRGIKVSRLDHFTAILPPNLKRLIVDFLVIRDDDAGVTHAIDVENCQVSTRHPRQLEYLRVYNSRMVNNWLLGEQSVVDLSNIRTLDIYYEDTRLFKMVGSSLQHLKLSYYEFYSAAGPIDLGPNPNIRTISLKAPAEFIMADPSESLLPHVVSPNLERLNLILDQYEELNFGGWEDIDAILDSERFAMLRHVGLYILDRCGIFDVNDALLANLCKRLPSLNSKGILHMHCSETLHLEIHDSSSIIGRDLDWSDD